MPRRYRLPRNEVFRCADCDRSGRWNYFVTPTLCKKCAAQRRHVIPNVNVTISDTLVVTKVVEKRLRKIAQAEIPRSKSEVIADKIQSFIFFPFLVSAVFLANSLFDNSSAAWWLSISIGCLIPLGINWIIDLVMSKPRNERMNKVTVRVRQLAEERKKAIEETARFYSSPEWALMRKQVVLEEGTICALCKREIRKKDDITVDHIKPRSKYPDLALERSNLHVVCRKCNSSKGTDESYE